MYRNPRPHGNLPNGSTCKKIKHVNGEETHQDFLIFINQHDNSQTTLTIESLAKESQRRSYYYFFKHHTCYDLLPGSAKLVILDTDLHVRKAFFALVYNNVRAAILWNSKQHSFVGMLTITDFVKALVSYFNPKCSRMEEFEMDTISKWRNVQGVLHSKLVHVSPETSLLDASLKLIKYKVHRLPVIDPVSGNPLHILTHKRILKYFYLNRNQLPDEKLMSSSLAQLKLGTYVPHVHLVEKSTPVIQALKVFLEYRVSCLPVIDEQKRLVELYAKFDVFNLAVTRTYNNLEIPVYHALEFHRSNRSRYPRPITCSKEDTLRNVIELVVNTGVHCLIIVDNKEEVEGVISLSDILQFLVSHNLQNKQIF